ncbi:MFS transporter [Bacillus sp. FSL W7-1360]
MDQLQNKSLQRKKWLMYLLLIAIFMLGFFERFAPAVFASDLMAEFRTSGSMLGTMTAMYFVTYTALQIPAGVLADRVGPREIVGIGAVIAGLGSLIFSFAPTYALVSIGRLLVGLGGATVFIGIMKFNAEWFAKERYGLISGITLLLGNLGAALSAGPLAVLLSYATWRNTFFLTGLIAITLGILIYAVVRNSPQEVGFNQTQAVSRKKNRNRWDNELRSVFAEKSVWPVLIASVGTNAVFYAFVGLWGVPLLTDSFQLTIREASLYTTAGLVGYGIASVVIGWCSDKAGVRKPFVVVSSVLACVGWLGLLIAPWQPGWSGFLLYTIVGVSAAQMVVSFAVVKEAVSPLVAGMALALVNAGVFLAVGGIQPLFGLIMDMMSDGAQVSGVSVYTFTHYQWGLGMMFFISAVGMIVSMFVKETYCGREIEMEQKEVNEG